MQNKDKPGAVPKAGSYRKTSAEIVSEARNSLMSSGSVKLVSTRRPITPNVNKRQLYVDGHPAGRPPSAFNLKYLQYETRALPCLEPINQNGEGREVKRVERSGSLGTIQESTSKTKLPALIERPKISSAGSHENCKLCPVKFIQISLEISIKLTRDYIVHLQKQNDLNATKFRARKINKGNDFCPFSLPCSQ